MTNRNEGEGVPPAVKLARIDKYDCRHGHHDIEIYKGLIDMCGHDICKCCGQRYGFINGSSGSGGFFWTPKATCEFCGGRSEYWGDWKLKV